MLLGSWASPARAERADPIRECIAAHADGQTQRDAGQLLAARASFLSCTTEVCPAVIRKECADFHQQVERALPSVVLVATARGRDVPEASIRVTVDAATTPLPLDGRAISLDPGQHQFVFRLPDGTTRTVPILLREGEQYRRVVADFDRAPTSEEEADGSFWPSSPLPYVLGGVGALALGSFVYFAAEGKAKEDELDRCAPECDPSEVDVMQRRYLIADVSLGTSLVAFGLGTYLFFSDRRPSQPSPRAAERSVTWGVQGRLGSQPTLGVVASGRF